MIKEEYLKQIESDFNNCSWYDLLHVGFGRNAPEKRVIFKVYDDVGLPEFFAVVVESWAFDSDCDDLQFEDFKYDLYKVEPKSIEVIVWDKVI